VLPGRDVDPELCKKTPIDTTNKLFIIIYYFVLSSVYLSMAASLAATWE
jgi:hypothetical protein